MAKHAILSPSAADRWMTCPASVVLSEGLEDERESSRYSDEGTAAHYLSDMCLRDGRHPAEYLGQFLVVDGEGETMICGSAEEVDIRSPDDANVFEIDVEFAGHVNHYVQAVRGYAGGTGALLFEQRVSISAYTGEEGAEGTSDAVVLLGDEVQIHDLKFGQGVYVDVKETRQLKIYALGVVREMEDLFDIASVRTVIHQPRIHPVPSEDVMSIDDLRAFGEEVRAAAKRVDDLRALAAQGIEPGQEDYAPAEKACRFCPAKAKCPGLQAHVLEVSRMEFDGLGEPTQPVEPTTLPGPDLTLALAAVPLLEIWAKAIRAESEARMFRGEEVDGLKVVQGRRGARAWGDKAAAEEAMKSMRVGADRMYSRKLISPTQAEKLAKEGVIGPRQWPKLEAMVVQPEGKPTVVPVSDPRPALNMAQPAGDFDGLGMEDLV